MSLNATQPLEPRGFSGNGSSKFIIIIFLSAKLIMYFSVYQFNYYKVYHQVVKDIWTKANITCQYSREKGEKNNFHFHKEQI